MVVCVLPFYNLHCPSIAFKYGVYVAIVSLIDQNKECQTISCALLHNTCAARALLRIHHCVGNRNC